MCRNTALQRAATAPAGSAGCMCAHVVSNSPLVPKAPYIHCTQAEPAWHCCGWREMAATRSRPLPDAPLAMHELRLKGSKVSRGHTWERWSQSSNWWGHQPQTVICGRRGGAREGGGRHSARVQSGEGCGRFFGGLQACKSRTEKFRCATKVQGQGQVLLSTREDKASVEIIKVRAEGSQAALGMRGGFHARRSPGMRGCHVGAKLVQGPPVRRSTAAWARPRAPQPTPSPAGQRSAAGGQVNQLVASAAAKQPACMGWCGGHAEPSPASRGCMCFASPCLPHVLKQHKPANHGPSQGTHHNRLHELQPVLQAVRVLHVPARHTAWQAWSAFATAVRMQRMRLQMGLGLCLARARFCPSGCRKCTRRSGWGAGGAAGAAGAATRQSSMPRATEGNPVHWTARAQLTQASLSRPYLQEVRPHQSFMPSAPGGRSLRNQACWKMSSSPMRFSGLGFSMPGAAQRREGALFAGACWGAGRWWGVD